MSAQEMMEQFPYSNSQARAVYIQSMQVPYSRRTVSFGARVASFVDALVWLLLGVGAVLVLMFSLYRNNILVKLARDLSVEQNYLSLERTLLGGPDWGTPLLEKPLPALVLVASGQPSARVPTQSSPSPASAESPAVPTLQTQVAVAPIVTNLAAQPEVIAPSSSARVNDVSRGKRTTGDGDTSVSSSTLTPTPTDTARPDGEREVSVATTRFAANIPERAEINVASRAVTRKRSSTPTKRVTKTNPVPETSPPVTSKPEASPTLASPPVTSKPAASRGASSLKDAIRSAVNKTASP